MFTPAQTGAALGPVNYLLLSHVRMPSSLRPFVCSPIPVWVNRDFSPCFQDLVFGCIPNIVTLLLIMVYHKRSSNTHNQKTRKCFEILGLRRSLSVEILPAIATFLTVIQSFQLALHYNKNAELGKHTWLYVFVESVTWISSSWMLHHDYEVIMSDYKILRIWWCLRPIFHIPYLYTLVSLSKALQYFDLWQEILLVVISFMFGVSVMIIGWKTSAAIRPKMMELSSFTEPLLDSKVSQTNSSTPSLDDSLWRKLLFTWVTPLMDLGITRQLDFEDLFLLPDTLEPRNCCKRLFKSWSEESKKSANDRSFFHAIYIAYRWQYLAIGIVKILNDSLGFAGPLLLNVIVRSIEDGSEKSIYQGFWCALTIGIVSALRAFLGTQYTFLVSKLRLQLRSSIIILIYHKALSISLAERSLFSNGEIQTLMSVDAERTINLCGSLHDLWSLPLQMLVALSLLYLQVKFAFVAGLGVIILLIPVNKMIATRIGEASQLMMKAKDDRVRKMGEILTYIRTIKMYAWEDLFSNRVMESRKEEVKHLGVRKYLDAWCVYFWATTPILFSFFTFGLYSLLGHTMNAATVFTSLALFNMLISPLNSFPWVINGIIEASVSISRLSGFLLCSEITKEDSGSQDVRYEMLNLTEESGKMNSQNRSVVLCNASFTWDHSSQQNPIVTLKSINLTIPQGLKVLVIGEIGSGKSSLFQAILGEMRCTQGLLETWGRFSYVSQSPWILSGTIRDNILFGKPFDEDRFERVMSACALDIDVERMMGRDLCMIGENGFNLSGGQKARLALARAIYQDSDVYLLDDPLSSVDAHVASWILENAIAGPLMSGKTIILSTYNVQALSLANMVIFVENGTVAWSGGIDDFKNYFGKCGPNSGKGLVDHYLNSSNIDKLSTSATTSSKDTESTGVLFKQGVLQEGPVLLVGEEGRVQGAVRAKVYWIYISFIGMTWVLIILISTVLMQSSRNGSDFWLSIWVNRTSNIDTDTSFYLRIFLCIAVANSVFTAARAFSFAYGGLSAAFKVHESLLKRVMAAPVYFFDQNPKGRILNRFSSDQYAVDDSLPFISNILLANFFSLLGIIIVLCVVQWTFLIVLIPLSYFYIGLQKYYRCTSRELRRLDSTSRSPIYSSFTETLDGTAIIRAFRAQNIFCAKHEDHVQLNQRSSYSEISASLWLSIRLQLIAACIIFFISIMSFVGHREKSWISTATSGLVGLGLSYATPIISLLSDLLSTFTETEKEMVSVERISEYMEVEKEKAGDIQQIKASWPSLGGIQFHKVTLLYGPSNPPALRNLSLKIQGGCQVGIAGRTGAGKSSILNVLFRLVQPTSGYISVDDIDTAKVPLKYLRSKMAIVPQNPFLFEGTIRENVDPDERSTDLQIWNVLEKCHLKEVVTLFGGLDMHVSEGGENFSFGQRQLLCLARSFLQCTKVLCLDECTANVDPHTSFMLQKAIESVCERVTVITIAHRLSTIMNLNRVFILEHGELVEEGNPSVLICDSESKFSNLAKASCEYVVQP